MLSTVFLLTASMVIGQAEDISPHYQHLKDLEYFVGDWEIVGTLKVTGDFQGLDEFEGVPLRQVLSYQWMKNKNFMLVSARNTGEKLISYQGFIGWDPVTERIQSRDVNSQGAWHKYVHIKRDFGWVMEGTAVYPGEAEGVYRAEIRIADKNSFRHVGKGTLKQGGKTSTVTLVYEAKRK